MLLELTQLILNEHNKFQYSPFTSDWDIWFNIMYRNLMAELEEKNHQISRNDFLDNVSVSYFMVVYVLVAGPTHGLSPTVLLKP